MKPISKVTLPLVMSAFMLGATSCLNDEPLIDWSVIEPVIELADSDHAQYENNMQRGDVAEFMIIVNYTESYASDVTETIEVQLEVDLDTIAVINAGLSASEQPFEAFPTASYEDLRLNATIPPGQRETPSISTSTSTKTSRWAGPTSSLSKSPVQVTATSSAATSTILSSRSTWLSLK